MNARLSLAATRAAGGAAEEDPNARLAALLLELARCVDPDVAATLPSRLDDDPRLEAMRGVLLEREQVALARLQQKFDDPREFADAVGAVLPAAFALAATDGDRLGQSIAPTVERATQASIQKNPGKMVDILYPVMGPAIRKAIAETLEGTLQSLNQALKHSLSWRGLKWRIEAWRSGSTFADVVMRHTAVFSVEHLFLVHRKTGLLLAHVARDDATTRDPQLVSAMLSAIQDFVRDSFDESGSGGTSGRSIDSLRLGDLLLWCEEGPSAFLAAVIHGNPPAMLRTRLGDTLGSIHDQWRGALDDFQGDTAAFDEAANLMRPCLISQVAETHKKKSPLLWIIPLALLIALGYWIGERVVEGRRVDAYAAALQEQPGIVVTAAERRDGKWWVSGLRDPLAAQPEALLAQTRLDPARIVGRWEPYQALHPAIMLKRLQASLNPPATVSLAQDANGIRATGSAPQRWMERARAFVLTLPAGAPAVDLSALQDVQDPDYIRLRDAIQAQLIHFDFSMPRPAADQDGKLDAVAGYMRELAQVARALGIPVKVTIVGHADATGKDTSNLALSVGRAEVVRSMLRARGVDPAVLAVRGAGPLEPLRPGASEDELSMNRRVSFGVSTGD
ncbi:OmpA family protein [Variovorax saccharolyticus]|uniref:OmpA family protein n=1 Tax=Variovorax saccharolyticus TaxID=3053516 RepID=UPI0025780899|nr:OmpA family protein [Variovorax sp. J31P216]MDM0026726.1 OmpA family protein [Variovorax sp. J31P216]